MPPWTSVLEMNGGMNIQGWLGQVRKGYAWPSSVRETRLATSRNTGKNSRITKSHLTLRLRFQKRLHRAFTPGLPSVIAVITNAPIVGPYGAKRARIMIGQANARLVSGVPIPPGIVTMPERNKSHHKNHDHPK